MWFGMTSSKKVFSPFHWPVMPVFKYTFAGKLSDHQANCEMTGFSLLLERAQYPSKAQNSQHKVTNIMARWSVAASSGFMCSYIRGAQQQQWRQMKDVGNSIMGIINIVLLWWLDGWAVVVLSSNLLGLEIKMDAGLVVIQWKCTR